MPRRIGRSASGMGGFSEEGAYVVASCLGLDSDSVGSRVAAAANALVRSRVRRVRVSVEFFIGAMVVLSWPQGQGTGERRDLSGAMLRDRVVAGELDWRATIHTAVCGEWSCRL